MSERIQRWCGICFQWREQIVGRCAACGNAYMTGAPVPLPFPRAGRHEMSDIEYSPRIREAIMGPLIDRRMADAIVSDVLRVAEEVGEIVPSAIHQGGVESERSRIAALVRDKAEGTWEPAVETAMRDLAREITSGGQSAALPLPRTLAPTEETNDGR